jgi:hypothetical protein
MPVETALGIARVRIGEKAGRAAFEKPGAGDRVKDVTLVFEPR